MAADKNQPKAEEAKANIAKLEAPEGATSITIGGEEYEVDQKTNLLSVPSHLVGEALAHGYTKARAK